MKTAVLKDAWFCPGGHHGEFWHRRMAVFGRSNAETTELQITSEPTAQGKAANVGRCEKEWIYFDADGMIALQAAVNRRVCELRAAGFLPAEPKANL